MKCYTTDTRVIPFAFFWRPPHYTFHIWKWCFYMCKCEIEDNHRHQPGV